jgi:hypothetical protein
VNRVLKVPSETETQDDWTEIALKSMRFDLDLPDRVFTLSNLRNPRE